VRGSCLPRSSKAPAEDAQKVIDDLHRRICQLPLYAHLSCPLWTGQRFSLSRGPKIRSRRIETGYIHLDLHPRSRQTLYNCFYIGKLTIDFGTNISGACYKVNKLRICARIACPM
jgi:hypothetical protein